MTHNVPDKWVYGLIDAISNYGRAFNRKPALVEFSVPDWDRFRLGPKSTICDIPVRCNIGLAQGRIKLRATLPKPQLSAWHQKSDALDFPVGQPVTFTTKSGRQLNGTVVHVDRQENQAVYTIHQFPDGPRYF